MILVTGASGFIGKAIARSLGDQAIALSRSGELPFDHQVVSDLTQPNAIEDLIGQLRPYDITQIIHTAAITPWTKDADFSLDLAMAKTLAHVSESLEIQRLIFLSGWIVYDMEGKSPFNEMTSIKPTSLYAESKVAVEEYFDAHLKKTALLNLRLASIYGPGQTSAGLIPNLVQTALSTGNIAINAVTTKRDYLFIDDVTRAVEKLVAMDTGARMDLNIGSGASSAVIEVAKAIQHAVRNVTGRSVALEIAKEPKESEPVDNQLDIEKAQTLGLLDAVTDVSEGMKEYVAWKNA